MAIAERAPWGPSSKIGALLLLAAACRTPAPLAGDIDTPDAGSTAPRVAECPNQEPAPGSPCAEPASCEFGVECCRGGCFASLSCTCLDGRWACSAADACLGVDTDLCGNTVAGVAFSKCSADSDCEKNCHAPPGYVDVCAVAGGKCLRVLKDGGIDGSAAADLAPADASGGVDGPSGDATPTDAGAD